MLLHPQAAPGSILATLADSATPPAKLHAARANAMRTLFVLGQLARHGAHVQHRAVPVTSVQLVNGHSCVDCSVLGSGTAGGRVIDAAAADESKTGPQSRTLDELMSVLIAFHGLPAGKHYTKRGCGIMHVLLLCMEAHTF